MCVFVSVVYITDTIKFIWRLHNFTGGGRDKYDKPSKISDVCRMSGMLWNYDGSIISGLK